MKFTLKNRTGDDYIMKLINVIDMKNQEFIKNYNQEFLNIYQDWVPFVTDKNFEEYIKNMNDIAEGINNNGVKEKYYWFVDNNGIIGSGSIRINPEVDSNVEIFSGNIFYQIVPSKRKQGYGTMLCHFLLEEMHQLGFKNAIITCYQNNIGSINIIKSNYGKLIETVNGDGSIEGSHFITNRYSIDIDKSLEQYNYDMLKKH